MTKFDVNLSGLTSMYISPAEALRRYKVSKPTLYTDMNNGTLSYKVDDRKRRKIDVAELDRLYEKKTSGAPAPEPTSVHNTNGHTELNVNQTSIQQLEILQHKIEFLERELRARREETERWQEAFDKAQTTADKITALLEDRSSSSRPSDNRDEQIDKLTKLLENQGREARAQNQKIAALEQTLKDMRRQNQRLFTEVKETRNKSLFERFFGKAEEGRAPQRSRTPRERGRLGASGD